MNKDKVVEQKNILSWMDNNNSPFELFNSVSWLVNKLVDNNNIDNKAEWSMEYEMIYNSQLLET
ncbi:MAG TPA: hypothetical protein PKE38_14560 [Ignavibacteriaceae bacterium]|nr:hypothetical protein [Ignavibacteriaceae bacterium]